MFFQQPHRSDLLAKEVDRHTEDVIDQLDCIEENVIGVQSDIQQLRLSMTRLGSLREKLHAVTE